MELVGALTNDEIQSGSSDYEQLVGSSGPVIS
jgi:hypothetical protein